MCTFFQGQALMHNQNSWNPWLFWFKLVRELLYYVIFFVWNIIIEGETLYFNSPLKDKITCIPSYIFVLIVIIMLYSKCHILDNFFYIVTFITVNQLLFACELFRQVRESIVVVVVNISRRELVPNISRRELVYQK